MIICFDVDGTLIDEQEQPVREMVELANALYRAGERVYCWSGGGAVYARQAADRVGLSPFISCLAKDRVTPVGVPDLVIDDEEGWGRLQLIVRCGNGPTILAEPAP